MAGGTCLDGSHGHYESKKSPPESEILEYYLDGKELRDTDDIYLINELKSIGLLRCGFSIKAKKETMKTTELGRMVLKAKVY